jgi:hypothetical protein
LLSPVMHPFCHSTSSSGSSMPVTTFASIVTTQFLSGTDPVRRQKLQCLTRRSASRRQQSKPGPGGTYTRR